MAIISNTIIVNWTIHACIWRIYSIIISFPSFYTLLWSFLIHFEAFLLASFFIIVSRFVWNFYAAIWWLFLALFICFLFWCFFLSWHRSTSPSTVFVILFWTDFSLHLDGLWKPNLNYSFLLFVFVVPFSMGKNPEWIQEHFQCIFHWFIPLSFSIAWIYLNSSNLYWINIFVFVV